MSAPHPLMTTAEVAAAFRVGKMTVYRWRHAGKLTAITGPGEKPPIRYLRAEVQALLAGEPLTPEQVTALRGKLLGGGQ